MAGRASAATMTDITLRLAEHLRGGDAEVGLVVAHIALAGKIIAREISRARLIGRIGTTGAVNIQGEVVKTLDAWSNDVIVQALTASGIVCTMISEEMAEPLHLADRCEAGRYVVCFDPVDRSSNLDVNGIVGTIFSIRHRHGDGAYHLKTDAQQPASAQLAAGYIMYGPSTLLVYTAGDGVAAFTLDGTIGEFIRWNSHIEIPARGQIYSVNDAHAPCGATSSICASATSVLAVRTPHGTLAPWWRTSITLCSRAASISTQPRRARAGMRPPASSGCSTKRRRWLS